MYEIKLHSDPGDEKQSLLTKHADIAFAAAHSAREHLHPQRRSRKAVSQVRARC